jgi:hypothetical protein
MMPYRDVLLGSAKLITLWSFSQFIFLEVSDCDEMFAGLQPIARFIPGLLYICALAYSFCWAGSRYIKLVVFACVSPFTPAGPSDLDSLVVNVLSSMTRPLLGVAMTGCYYFSGKSVSDTPGILTDDVCYTLLLDKGAWNLGLLILCFPNLVRVAQNLRQFYSTGKRHPRLTNAGKYMSKLLVTVAGVIYPGAITVERYPIFFWFWIASMIFSVLYSFIWDITMDWGIIVSRRSWLCIPFGRLQFRRWGLLSESAVPYVVAALINFVARFFFIYTLVPRGSLELQSKFQHWYSLFDFFAPTVEILRRAMWCLLWMEFKQLQINKQEPIRELTGIQAIEKIAGREQWVTPCKAKDFAVVVAFLLGILLAMYTTRGNALQEPPH